MNTIPLFHSSTHFGIQIITDDEYKLSICIFKFAFYYVYKKIKFTLHNMIILLTTNVYFIIWSFSWQQMYISWYDQWSLPWQHKYTISAYNNTYWMTHIVFLEAGHLINLTEIDNDGKSLMYVVNVILFGRIYDILSRIKKHWKFLVMSDWFDWKSIFIM